MTDPTPSGSPEPEPAEQGPPDVEPAPLNRAARRAKAGHAEPTHVGPRADLARRVRGGRPRAKRRR